MTFSPIIAGLAAGAAGLSNRGMNISGRGGVYQGGQITGPLRAMAGAIGGASPSSMATGGGNSYEPGSPAYNAQEAFAAMTAKAEKDVIRDPVTGGVLGYTEAAGVTPLPGQTVNIYDPSGTNVIRTQTGQASQNQASQGPKDYTAMFADQISALQGAFSQSMDRQMEQYRLIQEEQNKRMEALQQQMQQAMIAQQQRPEVAGVKMASGSAGSPMQIARRGVSGAFGRRGIRISGLNIR